MEFSFSSSLAGNVRVMLTQDSKPICLTKCVEGLPFGMYGSLLMSLSWYFECYKWFLKAAVVKSGLFCFYILAPEDNLVYHYCVVRYTKQKSTASSGQEVERPVKNERNPLNEQAPNCHLNEQVPVCPSPGLASSTEDINADHASSTSKENFVYCDRNVCERVRKQESDQATVLPYEGLPKSFVKIDPSYLRTLSQTHSGWIFGALAEFVDNSRDAHASRLDISVEYLYSKRFGKKIPVLSVIDDGDGMSHDDIVRMLSFGHKQIDGEDKDRIGRFGIGFKTGAMKLGKDALVLTQSARSRSVAFLSQSYNENKDNVEIPIVSYTKNGRYMEIDLSIQSEESANFNLSAIKECSPFNEYFIGEQLGKFGENGTGTQIYIWNLDEWGSDYTLEWVGGKIGDGYNQNPGDILIRSRRIKSRSGQISHEVKSRPLAKSLSRTVTVKGSIMARPVQLTLGRSQIEWKRMNCGIFLYWNGRLIEAYKRVGGMKYNADMGRGAIGVADVTNIMDNGKGQVFVLNSKQGFQDCEVYAKLEDWLGKKFDEYWDEKFDNLDLKRGDELQYEPDHEWVQCDKCRKWRLLSSDFNSQNLPSEWFVFCFCCTLQELFK
ncbi:hypothetical protein AXF42_Ash009316 [Apostasia shenzhenica]|uniref:CW-type domain-containing protein n=1 Tax=Apostasia shenzhenica TaxID=1088818 RepID=A0A2I0B3R6_9ASPA|nr:hypothetical protein AXF42_Ash009316 [Apostasia shenzhenica]